MKKQLILIKLLSLCQIIIIQKEGTRLLNIV